MIDPRLAEVIGKTFDVDAAGITAVSGVDTIDGWDSFGQLGLMMAVEKRFGLKFPTEAIVQLDTAGKIQDALSELGAL